MSAFSPPPHDPRVERFHSLFDAFAACGATAAGGVHRLCASPADGEARAVFAAAVRDAGGTVSIDAVGNQYGLFALAPRHGAPQDDVPQENVPLVMCGSHLDSQPQGGRFDGALGVAAAVAAGAALMAAKKATETAGAPFAADFCAVNWTNEEGARFRPSLLGSGFFAGRHDAAYALARTDDSGTSLGEALAAIGQCGNDAPPKTPAAYLELHVEQGPALEQAGATIGIVGRNWGAAKFEVRFDGEPAHTGPTPMPRRRDALLAAAYLIAQTRAIADRWPGIVHSSVGRLLVLPNSSNVVPSAVSLSVEIRAADDRILAEAAALAADAVRDAAARAGVDVGVFEPAERPGRELPRDMRDLTAACAEALGLPHLGLDTISGHDALSLLGLCPTGLVFVPSAGGIAHSEREYTAPGDLEAGFRLLLEAATRLCRAGGMVEAAIHGAADACDPVHTAR
ncbi:allantoate amidohydrolase [Ancylobacter sp.]|uniref:allantoate amidohydrolase n=1 Tax=Ancylobacter sp. TaxID=1872567 RepID=UPI003D12FE5D